MRAASHSGGSARRFGPNGAFQPEYSKDDPGLRAHGVAERLGDGTTKLYPLPQSNLDTYVKLRPADLKLNPIAATGNQYEREETTGPHQVEGNKLWFGNNFYNAEGERGVDTFGYFDAATRLYQLYSPPEGASYEVSAILVRRDAIWLGLDHSGKDISRFPGGLVSRFEVRTNTSGKTEIVPIARFVLRLLRMSDGS